MALPHLEDDDGENDQSGGLVSLSESSGDGTQQASLSAFSPVPREGSLSPIDEDPSRIHSRLRSVPRSSV
jgi:hypothetical protein